MKRFKIINLIIGIILFLTTTLNAQIGYYDAPYTRYEANLGTLTNATATAKSYTQSTLQSEASDQVCVDLSGAGASVAWTVTADGDGLVIRYSLPDGQSGSLDVYANNVFVATLNLTTYYSWEYLSSNGNPNNVGITNTNARMRFDEVRMLLPSKIITGGNLKLVRNTGNITIDFAELESVPAAVTASGGDVTYTGTGSNLQSFINSNGGATIYIPAGIYNMGTELYLGTANTVLKGAGMWYTELHFTNNGGGNGGLRANATAISYSGLYLSTVRNSRSSSYKGINGVYTSGSSITNVWAEHFECGAWIGQYNAGSIAIADGFTISNCRFRNNYADGINLCKGTSNTIVEHCSFRNNGDDDMAIWSANSLECRNNTFRYNTSENLWRASGCAIYGGYNNQAHHLLIKDNLEAGLKVNNSFAGAPFNSSGMHVFSDITIIACGTFNDLYNNPVGAVDIACFSVAGTMIKNVKFVNITITDSRNDAIYISKKNGQGFYNLTFENISVNGTGKEYPYNDFIGRPTWGRGFGVLFVGSPSGYGSWCNMTYTNIGGHAASDVDKTQIGTFNWTKAGCGTYITSPLTGAVFGACGPPILITADASPANGTVDSVEFFVDSVKAGKDISFPYSYNLSSFTTASHKLYVRAFYSSPTDTVVSPVQEISVASIKGLIHTSTAPVIDGTAETQWTGFAKAGLDKISLGTFSGAADLSATYQVCYDATNLYFLVDVTDDVLKNDGGNRYDNDGLELFIDMGNDKNTSYGTDDYTYNFVYNDPVIYENQHNAITGVTFAQALKTGGYIMEIKIPWTTLGTTPVQGSGVFMGFDLHVDDDDNGGARDAKKAWYDCADVAWKDPSSLGTLQESGCTTSIATDFINFQSTMLSNSPILQWDTYYKSNDSYFDILRDVNGSGNFQTIATVVASGTAGAISALSYMDYTVPTGDITYRISRVDKSGCKTLSEIIDIGFVTEVKANNAEIESNFYPNPFISSGNLSLRSGSVEDFSVTISDLNGKLLWNRKLPGNTIYSIGELIPQGMYILEIVDGNNKQTIKLIKL
jgi:hypothetical protein